MAFIEKLLILLNRHLCLFLSTANRTAIFHAWVFFFENKKVLPEKINLLYVLCFLKARFLLSKVNPSQTHNNMYAWGQVRMSLTVNLTCIILWGFFPLFQKSCKMLRT